MQGNPFHEAAIFGDIAGDPFKDTSLVALNPIIKFTKIFGLPDLEIAISIDFYSVALYVCAGFFIVALYFVCCWLYKMLIIKQ